MTSRLGMEYGNSVYNDFAFTPVVEYSYLRFEFVCVVYSGRVHILEDRSLRLDGVTMDDVGEYSCEADNAVGSVSATGSLYVHCKYGNANDIISSSPIKRCT